MYLYTESLRTSVIFFASGKLSALTFRTSAVTTRVPDSLYAVVDAVCEVELVVWFWAVVGPLPDCGSEDDVVVVVGCVVV